MTDNYPHNPDDANKWILLQEACIIDSKNPVIKDIALDLFDACLRRPKVYILLAMAMARDTIEYETDIKQFGHEDIAGVTRAPRRNDAIDAYQRGHDDCDAKARFFVALCLAKDIPARLWPLWKQGVLTHVAAEVQLNGTWHHVETILARAKFGEMHTDVPKEPKTGKWKMS